MPADLTQNPFSPYNLAMKCPECDLEQPDDTAICANCGLSFEAWHAHNPAAVKPAPDSGMTFPVQEEEEPAPREKDEPDPEEEPTPEETSPSAETPKTTTENPPTVEKKSFKWSPLHSAGLGLITVVVLTVLICARRSPPPAPGAGEASSPATPEVSSAESVTPALGSPTASATLIATPVNSLLPDAPTAVLSAAPVHHQPKNPEPAVTPAENLSPEKSAAAAKDEPVTMEIPSDESAAKPADTSTEAPSPVPASGAKDLLESSEPVAASTPAATP